MRLLRFVAAILLAVFALMSLLVGAVTAAFKLRAFSPPADAAPELLDLMAATSWAQIALWLVVSALYLVVVVKLMRRAKTFVFWAAAFLLHIVSLLWTRGSDAYQAAFSTTEMQADYAVVALNLAVGAFILWLGRTHLD